MIIILITTGFDELFVVQAGAQLRQDGLAVNLVSNVAGLVTGLSGFTLKPDHTLSSLPAAAPALLIIPGGDQSVPALAADPRVHELLTRVINHGGRVVLPAGAEEWFTLAGDAETAVLLYEPGIYDDSFIKNLSDWMFVS